MDVTLDVGKNITGLIQQLATQIGVTADKVFPWYVKQSMIEGYSFFIISMVIVIIALTFLFVSTFKRFSGDTKSALAAISGVLFFFVLFANCLGGAEHYSKIANPEYHAMKQMTYHIGKMTGK